MSYLPISSTPELDAGVFGFVNGKAAYNVHILARRDAGWVGTSVFHDAAQYLDNTQQFVNTPSVGQTLYLVSTSASDTAAGTGARTVRITYLDGSGNQQTTTQTTNGTTPVNIGTGYTYIQWIENATVGSNNASVGDVAITSTNGAATVATTFEIIKASGNKSLSGRYMVPTGYSAYLTSFDGLAIGNTMDARIRSAVFSDDRSLSSVLHFQDSMFLASGQNMESNLPYLKQPAGAEIRIIVAPGAAPASNRFDGSLTMLLVAD